MDRFFVNKENIDLDNMKMLIVGEDVKHISKVLRYNIGDKLELCDGENNEYIGQICGIDKTEIYIDIIEKLDAKRESNLNVILYQGLPKSQKMEYILQKLTECGVAEIVLVDTARSVVNIDDKKSDKKFERWERIIYEASKQCKRGRVPKLRGILTFKQALEDMKNNDYNISPYEEEKSLGIKEVLSSSECRAALEKESSRLGIFIGPEGGFASDENEMIKNQGTKSVTMGPRIFRTETAGVVACAIAQYELGDIGGK